MVAPTLDGTATGQASAASTVSATFSSTKTNDIICALVHFENNSSTTPIFGTGASGGGLTWQKRAGLSTVHDISNIELWWAPASAILTTQIISVTTNAAFDDASILVFGVNGCNFLQPWDENARALQTNPTLGSPTYTFSTSNADDFLIFGIGSSAGLAAIGTIPAGWTTIGFHENSGGTRFSSIGAVGLGVTAIQTGQTATWGSAINAISLFAALTADSSVAAATPFIDLSNTNTAVNVSSVGFSLAAPVAGDTLFLISQAVNGAAISGISGGGLTWSLRLRSHGSPNGSLEIWSAKSASVLVPFTATVTYGAAVTDLCIVGMSVSNLSAAVFDSNGSLPAHASNSTSLATWTPSISGISTSQASDLLLALVGFGTSTSPTLPAGFVLLASLTTTGGGAFASLMAAFMVVNATQSGITEAWGSLTDGSGGIFAGEFIADALTSVVGGGSAIVASSLFFGAD